MRVLSLLFCLIGSSVLGSSAAAQTIPTVGTDATFDLATWNVEHFGNAAEPPSNDALQAEQVLAVLQAADIDLWAMQELDIESDFDALVEDLGAPYEGLWFADETSFPIGYGFIYNTDVVEVLEAEPVLDQFSYEFAFRPPLLLRANLTLPSGTVENARILNVHAKCCGDQTSYNRRVAASNALKNYVDNFLTLDAPILVLGDFNDELRSSIFGGQPSPYQNFRDDADDYRFVSYVLDLANVPTNCANSACSDGSTLDHILLARTFEQSYVEGSMSRFGELLDEIPNYVTTTSDHIPVYAQFDFGQTTGADEDASAPRPFALRAPFPNPFRSATTLTYSLPAATDVRLEVFDALGRRVAMVEEGSRSAGTHEAVFEAEALPPGLYIARLSADGQRATRRLVRIP